MSWHPFSKVLIEILHSCMINLKAHPVSKWLHILNYKWANWKVTSYKNAIVYKTSDW